MEAKLVELKCSLDIDDTTYVAVEVRTDEGVLFVLRMPELVYGKIKYYHSHEYLVKQLETIVEAINRKD